MNEQERVTHNETRESMAVAALHLMTGMAGGLKKPRKNDIRPSSTWYSIHDAYFAGHIKRDQISNRK